MGLVKYLVAFAIFPNGDGKPTTPKVGEHGSSLVSCLRTRTTFCRYGISSQLPTSDGKQVVPPQKLRYPLASGCLDSN